MVSITNARSVIAGAEALSNIALGGTLVAIDPSRMSIGIAHIDARLLRGAR
jgi:hypothetical protein